MPCSEESNHSGYGWPRPPFSSLVSSTKEGNIEKLELDKMLLQDGKQELYIKMRVLEQQELDNKKRVEELQK